MALVPRVKLGSQGLEVSKQGLGCMGMSAFYGPPKPEQEMIELIHHAVNSGITFLDTSDIYGPHTNEVLLGKALKGIRHKVQLATKFAIAYDPATGSRSVHGDPEYVRAAIEGSLKRLDVDYVDLYYQHRPDTKIPIEITVGAMKKLVEEGKVKYLGLSEASADTIRRAHAVHPITAVQLEWSLWTRDAEKEVVPLCRELGIGIVAYSPLGRGFFSGLKASDLTDSDFRKGNPRFFPENYEKNKALYDKLAEIAGKRGATPGQLALSWVQHKGEDVVPIPGTTKVKNLEENIEALKIKLSPEEIQEIQDAVPHEDIEGTRYPDMAFTLIDTPPLEGYKEK
eukprot:TRINITY_DN475_c0_g3_i1.p1 TRINITY_DN475_c0_g3~~TRINITY_DN475_c0_g3_i1.p1  ORF type:complete len:350 (-),score=68.49 TRINITY_DN475_c0_g3_i1:439-1458(-)